MPGVSFRCANCLSPRGGANVRAKVDVSVEHANARASTVMTDDDNDDDANDGDFSDALREILGATFIPSPFLSFFSHSLVNYVIRNSKKFIKIRPYCDLIVYFYRTVISWQTSIE